MYDNLPDVQGTSKIFKLLKSVSEHNSPFNNAYGLLSNFMKLECTTSNRLSNSFFRD